MVEQPLQISRFVLGAALIITAAAAWGMSGIFVTVILKNSNGSSVSLAFWRDTIASAVFFLFTFLTGSQVRKIEKKDIPWLVSMGFFLGGFHILFNQSVILNGAAVTTVLQAAMPALVTVAAFYLWKEDLTREKWLSMLIIFTGTAMASGISVFSREETNMAGYMAGFAVPVFYAGWSLCGKSLVSKYGPTACLSVAFGIAAIMLLPLQPFTSQPFPLNSTIILAFCGLVFVSTFGAFSLYLLGMKHVEAGVAGILVMSEILFAGVYAFFLLGERLTPVQMWGTLLVITGVVFLSYRQNKKSGIRP